MGGWVGGQAEYVMVPYADWNLLKFPDKDQAMAKIRDLTMLSDIFSTGFHGARSRRRASRTKSWVTARGRSRSPLLFGAETVGLVLGLLRGHARVSFRQSPARRDADLPQEGQARPHHGVSRVLI